MAITKLEESVGTIESHPNAWENWANSEERVPLFSVTKTDEDSSEPVIVEYTMPKKPNPGLALKFLKMARDQGEVASVWLIEQAIGSDGYDALADELVSYDGDGQALLRGVVEKIQRVAMGGLDNPKG